MAIVLLLVLGGLMQAARSFAPQPGIGSDPAGTALACGYLLLTAHLAGNLFKRVGLPRLTGYLVAGIVTGPRLLALVSAPMVEDLRIINGVAVALIALTAGSELELRAMRPLVRTIAWMTLVAILGTTGLLAGSVFALRGFLPFMGELTSLQQLAVALVLAVTMVAQSPAIVVALRAEMNADGPLTRTVLGVVVVGDLVVILLFGGASTIAQAALGARADALHTAAALAWELVGSMIAGVGVGALVAVYLRKVQGGGALFIVAVCFVVAEVGQRVHFDPLLLALAAGVFLRNATSAGPRLLAEIDTASLPVYVVFFAVAGAGIHLDVLRVVGLPAAAFVSLRAAGFLAGSRIAARLAHAPEVVRRHAGFGLLPQAGLALALAMLLGKTFPRFGDGAGALTFGVVALNELVAPLLYRMALLRSGEAGDRRLRVTPAPQSDDAVSLAAAGGDG